VLGLFNLVFLLLVFIFNFHIFYQEVTSGCSKICQRNVSFLLSLVVTSQRIMVMCWLVKSAKLPRSKNQMQPVHRNGKLFEQKKKIQTFLDITVAGPCSSEIVAYPC